MSEVIREAVVAFGIPAVIMFATIGWILAKIEMHLKRIADVVERKKERKR